jgi:hypothetical protein
MTQESHLNRFRFRADTLETRKRREHRLPFFMQLNRGLQLSGPASIRKLTLSRRRESEFGQSPLQQRSVGICANSTV